MKRVPRSWHPLWWLPMAVIVVMAWANGTMPHEDDCPGGTDAGQFACWLEQQP